MHRKSKAKHTVWFSIPCAVFICVLLPLDLAHADWSIDRKSCASGYVGNVRDMAQNYHRFVGTKDNGARTLYLNKGVPESQDHELHVVGSYDGSGIVTVRRSQKPIVLVVSAYRAGQWQLILEPGARLARVILQGYDEQRIAGLPDNVEVLRRGRCGYAYNWEPRSPFEGKTHKKFQKFISDLQKTTGLVESSFQGVYGQGKEFAVPPVMNAFSAAPLKFDDPSIKETRAETLNRYRAYRDALPKGPAKTLSVLIQAMEMEKLPVHFVSSDPRTDRKGPRHFEALTLPEQRVLGTGQRLKCKSRSNILIVAGGEDNVINCSWGDQIFFTGGGRDVVDASWGNDLIDAGPGNDVIDASWGRDIVVFRDNWGQDVVTETCHATRVPDVSKIYGGERNADWKWPYNNFVVFGPGIHPKDLVWTSKSKLEHRPTGSSVTFNGNCFSFVFVEDGEFAPYIPPQKIKPKVVARKWQEQRSQQDWQKRLQKTRHHLAEIKRICTSTAAPKLCQHLRGVGIVFD